MSGYDPRDFESVITYMRREWPDAFRNPSRMFAVFCDLAPKLKPYGNIARQLSERGILSGLEAASANGDALEQARMMMKARHVLKNELLLGADRVEYFLTAFGNLYGVAARPVATPRETARTVPTARMVPAAQGVQSSQPLTAAQGVPPPQPLTAAHGVPPSQPLTAAQSVQSPRILPMSGVAGALTWKLDSGGVLTISGHGDMDDYTRRAYRQSTAPWSACQSAMVSAILKDGVTSVGQEAFSYCANLQSVLIPDGVTKIGYMAFRGAGLRRVTIPHSVREIGVSAFQECTELKSVKIPRGVEVIEAYAFAECKRLTSVTVPNSVRRIGYRAFRDCAQLGKAYVPADADVDSDAFDFHTVVVRW